MIGLPLAMASLLAAAPALREIRVPPALAAVTSAPELSGLVWSAALGRYLVVSDDTGVAARGTAHAPVLLGLSPAGDLDEAPIPITGVDSLNDAEAICEGPGGTFFLVTSHSPNREGRTHRARRQLLQLEVRGPGLAVLGRLDLTTVEGERSLLQLAGVDPGGRLDLEALAYRDGALLVGMKSPLTAAGAAVVLRLEDPGKALRAGKVARGALSRWVELPLCLDVPGGRGRVCQGVSDMLFLEDGSLMVAANAPRGGPDDGGGALWWIPEPARQGPPRLLRRFQGLKPEGLALTPRRQRVVVVFDRGREPPLWTELALPRSLAEGEIP